jgi:hypothetical protein
MSIEKDRLKDIAWKKWGPYLSERQWGTVREDYSADGNAWTFTTHDMARSKAWRWGEDGIGGICDRQQTFCLALSLWNTKDPILKERLFGLTGLEGNHGEDVKEIYYYLDATPTHSYLKMLYKYPQAAFPYEWLLQENARRTKLDPEFEIADTGIFNNNEYFDVLVEYAKADAEDVLLRITVQNHAVHDADINLLPTLWFRNTWDWDNSGYKPELFAIGDNAIEIRHREQDAYWLWTDQADELLFCENETNNLKLYQYNDGKKYPKDGINDYIIHQSKSINPDRGGTKCAVNFDLTIPAHQSKSIRLRLNKKQQQDSFADFDPIFNQRIAEADAFYRELQSGIPSAEERMIQRQALAGMIWCKQFYYYDVAQWLKGDPGQPIPPAERLQGRNKEWKHLNNTNIISMPDAWEYPWYASWDLAFHCISFCLIDPGFAKHQLLFLIHEWYMHPNGQLPAYEWAFGDTNPPVHAWAAWRIFEMDKHANDGVGDVAFLETVFHKLLMNFTWWVNRKDTEGNNIFEGGFLGMDNIGLFNRNSILPDGSFLEQSDGTSWMAMYSLNLMRIALELAMINPVYQDMANKFFEHFLYIAGAMDNMGENNSGLWDDEDEFFYDALRLPDKRTVKLKIRSMVGLIPLFAVEVLDDDMLKAQPEFAARLNWFLEKRPELANLVSRWGEKGVDEKHLLSLLRGHRMKRILYRMLDETEFLSDYGIRALSKYHEQHPFEINIAGVTLSVKYTPGESTTDLFGGNSNWRGPVWMPVNYLIIESLQRFHYYYGDDFKVEYPTNSGQYLSLNDVGNELIKRLNKLFLKGADGKRPVFGQTALFQTNPDFFNYILFYEYFHGDNGRGVGAAHQTGWTGLIAKLIQPR